MSKARDPSRIRPDATFQPGTIAYFARSSPPEGWLKCDGSAVSRVTYANLFTAIGETYGAGDGSTTFNLPDLRGEFVRGWDDGRGVDSGRVFGSAQMDALQGHKHRLPSAYSGGTANAPYGTFGSTPQTFNHSDGATTSNGHLSSTPSDDDGTNGSPRVAVETRSRNVALLACIKI